MSLLTASQQPAVVFSSLATLSVTGFADACGVVITEGDVLRYRIQRPLVHDDDTRPRALMSVPPLDAEPGAQAVGAHTVSTPFHGHAASGEPHYVGVVVHYWLAGYRPTDRDAIHAQLAVDLAVSAVAVERAA